MFTYLFGSCIERDTIDIKEIEECKRCGICQDKFYVKKNRIYQSIDEKCFKKYPHLKIFYLGKVKTYCSPKDLMII
jgi:hypothetical protein